MILDLLKRLGGSGLAGGAAGLTDELEDTGPAELPGQQPGPNLRHLLGSQVGGVGGSYIDMMRSGRRTGEMPGAMGAGMAGGNFNQDTPEPMAYPQQAGTTTGGLSSLFDGFDTDKFKKRLGHMSTGWAMGKNWDDSIRLGSMAAELGKHVPEDKLKGLLMLLRNQQ